MHYQPRKYPVAGDRVKIYGNVAIAADVEFTGHDVIHWVFDGIEGKRVYKEFYGCIEIHENCFIGAGARILPNVSIGPNAIVAAGAVVNKDVPPGTIVGGGQLKLSDLLKSLNKRDLNGAKRIRNLVVDLQKRYGKSFIECINYNELCCGLEI